MTYPAFLWATGIEDTFIPHTRPGLRALDEYELTQHYGQWRSDFDLVEETGVKYLRWGIPWYRVQPSPDRWNWSWVDEALDYLVNVKGITPILDLMHYGTPLWMESSFIDADYPQRVAEYAVAVVDRYKSLVRYYTPLNEPMVNADRCGNKAEWPPYLSGDDGYVKLTLALAKGIIHTTRAIKAEQQNAITVQVEALRQVFTNDPSLEGRVRYDNARQYLCFDLITGHVNEEYPLLNYLCEHGATESDFIWFRDHAASFEILGANYYPWSYEELKKAPDGSISPMPAPANGASIANVIRAVYERYQMPILITETSSNANIDGRMQWMDETIQSVRELRATGLPVLGYTWFPLFTMVDWAYRTGEGPIHDYLIHLGLYDSAFDRDGELVRHRTPLVEHYQNYLQQPMPAIATC
jgi:beta-glucosidase